MQLLKSSGPRGPRLHAAVRRSVTGEPVVYAGSETSQAQAIPRPPAPSLYDQTMTAGQCVYCQHCLPCPQELQVGWLIWLADRAHDGVTAELRKEYDGYAHVASECVQCGVCLERCPFGVDIMGKLEEAVRLFETAPA
jgi:predicted aldo/keto reductase-like oxidoreductase